jgi:anti-anti-sigma factor
MLSHRETPAPADGDQRWGGVQMSFTIQVTGRSIRPCGDLDLATAPSFDAVASHLIGEPGDVIVEMDDVPFIDSSGIRSLFELARALGDRGRVVVHRPRPQARRVLDLVHAGAVVEVAFD